MYVCITIIVTIILTKYTKNAYIFDTFSNWCTRKMPHVSLPCLPASLRKHVDTPEYLMGSEGRGEERERREERGDET
jgi:hypothetical protein